MTDEPHIRKAYAAAIGRDPGQTAFLQALETLYESLVPCLGEQPALAAARLAERLAEPESSCLFPVRWADSRGQPRQTRGFFIRYCTALGPWRGPIIFRRGLDISAAKALALSATLQYALAGLPAGGGFAGADADCRSMDDVECRRFCHAFAEAVYPFMPRDLYPSLWRGQLSRRELAYLSGRLRQLSALTGGAGSPPGPVPMLTYQQAAGWGLCHFAQLVLHRQTDAPLDGQSILIAGRDGAAGWAGERAARLGAHVVAVGDGGGCLHADGGLPLATLRAMAAQPELPLLLWAIRAPGVEYRPGPGLWDIPADAAFLFGGPRLDSAGARRLLQNRCSAVFEGASGAATAGAARTLAAGGVLYMPAIAAGAGGATAALGQPPDLPRWEAERRLYAAMEDVFHAVWQESERDGRPGDMLHAAFTAALCPISTAIFDSGL